MKDKYLPETFKISYSSSHNGKKSINLSNKNQLLILSSKPEIISPSKEKWIEFWEKLEEIAIWDLEEAYEFCSLEGGFNWEIEINYTNKSLKSYGVNYEPKLVVGNKIISVIEELIEAIYELSGFELN